MEEACAARTLRCPTIAQMWGGLDFRFGSQAWIVPPHRARPVPSQLRKSPRWSGKETAREPCADLPQASPSNPVPLLSEPRTTTACSVSPIMPTCRAETAHLSSGTTSVRHNPEIGIMGEFVNERRVVTFDTVDRGGLDAEAKATANTFSYRSSSGILIRLGRGKKGRRST
jgi:hypothetical protein